MKTSEKLRIQWALSRYDWWLDLRHVSPRRRRELRRELKANLYESAESRGAKAAVARLGSVKTLAAETADSDPAKPRWYAGISIGLSVLVATILVALFAALNWAGGAADANTASEVTGSLFPFPGSSVSFDNHDDSLAVAFSPGWLPFALGLITFILVAKPWRLVTHHRADGAGHVLRTNAAE